MLAGFLLLTVVGAARAEQPQLGDDMEEFVFTAKSSQQSMTDNLVASARAGIDVAGRANATRPKIELPPLTLDGSATAKPATPL
jgi:hypothetical protein